MLESMVRSSQKKQGNVRSDGLEVPRKSGQSALLTTRPVKDGPNCPSRHAQRRLFRPPTHVKSILHSYSSFGEYKGPGNILGHRGPGHVSVMPAKLPHSSFPIPGYIGLCLGDTAWSRYEHLTRGRPETKASCKGTITTVINQVNYTFIRD